MITWLSEILCRRQLFVNKRKLTQNIHLNEPRSLETHVIGSVADEGTRLVARHSVYDEDSVVGFDSVEAEVPGVGAGRGANC